MTSPILYPDPDNLKRCPKCGETQATAEFGRDKNRPDGLNCWCKRCVRASAAQYRAEHPERAKQSDTEYKARNRELLCVRSCAYRAAHKDQRAEYRKRYKATHADEIKAYSKRHYSENAEELRASARLRRIEHPEKIAASLKKWRQANPQKYQEYSHRRRAWKHDSGGTFTPADIEAIRVAQGNRCYLCGKELTKYHIDHFIPLALGGSNDPGNLRLACPKCNQSKHAKHPFEIGRLI
jgi:5-methylcytosine-specific restriction endonuclease McrA